MTARNFTAALLLMVIALSPCNARAGAWTLDQGHWQMFTETTQSEASRSFDASSRAVLPTRFNKLLFQNTFEYGVTRALTLFVEPDYVIARVQTPFTKLTKAQSSSVEAGARLLLSQRFGELSLQGSYKTSGAFDLSVSANHDAGEQIELRLLYGTNFRLFGRPGFLDLQAGQRWITHPRPNETPVDLTAGLWVTRKLLVMAQSFNIVSAGDAIPPYTFYRTHKLELSVVQRLSRHWSLQTGVFFSPAGQNALQERGVSVSLWTQD